MIIYFLSCTFYLRFLIVAYHLYNMDNSFQNMKDNILVTLYLKLTIVKTHSYKNTDFY